jgi:hypothetical protein
MYGLVSSSANYPSDNGIQLDGSSSELSNFSATEFIAAYAFGGTLGVSPSGKMQVLLKDNEIETWVDVANTSITDNGVVVAKVTGAAVRLVLNPGTTPGTGNDTPFYHLDVFPADQPLADNFELMPQV